MIPIIHAGGRDCNGFRGFSCGRKCRSPKGLRAEGAAAAKKIFQGFSLIVLVEVGGVEPPSANGVGLSHMGVNRPAYAAEPVDTVTPPRGELASRG